MSTISRLRWVATLNLRMRSLGRILSVLRLVVVLLAEKLAPEPVLFLLLILILIVGLVLRLGWLRRRSLIRLRQNRLAHHLLLRWRRIYRPLPETKYLLEHVPLVAHGVIAGIRGLGSIEEGGRIVVRTGVVSQQIRGRVETHLN